MLFRLLRRLSDGGVSGPRQAVHREQEHKSESFHAVLSCYIVRSHGASRQVRPGSRRAKCAVKTLCGGRGEIDESFVAAVAGYRRQQGPIRGSNGGNIFRIVFPAEGGWDRNSAGNTMRNMLPP